MKKVYSKKVGGEVFALAPEQLEVFRNAGYLAITGNTSQEFMTVYTVVIAFYFGTQTQKISDAVAQSEEGKE